MHFQNFCATAIVDEYLIFFLKGPYREISFYYVFAVFIPSNSL